MDVAALRALDESVEKGTSRPKLTLLEEAQCVVSGQCCCDNVLYSAVVLS